MEIIRNKEFKKTYYAVIEGIPKKEDILNDYLIKDDKFYIWKIKRNFR